MDKEISYDLSILIPSRGEEFLNRTIQDIFEHSEASTEVIAVLDGDVTFGIPPEHPRLTTIVLDKSIGQRAATNLAAKQAKGKYFSKVDGHCSFAPGFDRILLEDIKPNQIVAPLMKNLHAFDWVCPKGHRRYQSPSGKCTECGLPTEKDVVWIAKKSPNSTSYSFDPEPHFMYFKDYSKRPEAQVTHPYSMSLQGSFFMCSAKDYWRLDLSSEKFGSWGSQGIEISQKFWLSGGEVRINTRTWYAHLFRTQGGDFGFPYQQMPHSKIVATRSVVKDYFYKAKFLKQIYPVSRVLEKFWPIYKWEYKDYIDVKKIELQIERSGLFSIQNRTTGEYHVFPAVNIKREAAKSEKLLKDGKHPTKSLQEAFKKGNDLWWHVEMFCQESKLGKHMAKHVPYHPILGAEKILTKGILYYTDGELPSPFAENIREQIHKAELPVTSVSLKPIHFGKNIHLKLKRSPATMVRQILTGLDNMTEDIIFFNEHDCLYDPSAYDFIPPDKNAYYYNINTVRINVEEGYGVRVNDLRQLSGLCAYRETLIAHYREKLRRIETEGKYDLRLGYEPGTHNRKERVDNLPSYTWKSKIGICDIRHPKCLTASRWRKEQFRNQKYTEGWEEVTELEGWGNIKELCKDLGL